MYEVAALAEALKYSVQSDGLGGSYSHQLISSSTHLLILHTSTHVRSYLMLAQTRAYEYSSTTHQLIYSSTHTLLMNPYAYS